MADEEQAVDPGAESLKIDPNLEYRVTRHERANGNAIEMLDPVNHPPGLPGSGRVRFRGHAKLIIGGQLANLDNFEIIAATTEEAWERFGVQAKEKATEIVKIAKARALRDKLAQAPKIGEFRRQRMGRRLGGNGGNGGRGL